MIILSAIITTTLLSCNEESNQFTFSTDDPEELHTEVNAFVDSIIMGSENSCEAYQTNSIKWWNSDFEGTAKLIPINQSLGKIKELEYLLIDSIEVKGDTIKGLITVRNWTDDFELSNVHIDGYDTNYVHLILKEQKLSEIIYYRRHPTRPLVVSIQNFYMDETEITSNAYTEYKPPTQKQLDSILVRKNEYSISE